MISSVVPAQAVGASASASWTVEICNAHTGCDAKATGDHGLSNTEAPGHGELYVNAALQDTCSISAVATNPSCSTDGGFYDDRHCWTATAKTESANTGAVNVGSADYGCGDGETGGDLVLIGIDRDIDPP